MHFDDDDDDDDDDDWSKIAEWSLPHLYLAPQLR